jgi:hypothetical protein
LCLEVLLVLAELLLLEELLLLLEELLLLLVLLLELLVLLLRAGLLLMLVQPLCGPRTCRRGRGGHPERRQGGEQPAARQLAGASLCDELVDWLLGWWLAMPKTSHSVLLSCDVARDAAGGLSGAYRVSAQYQCVGATGATGAMGATGAGLEEACRQGVT